jgi:signal transduction histidine kinase
VDLISILHEAVKRLSHEALRRNVTIAMEVPPEVTVSIASAALSHVVTNVMDNAVKFSPVGSEVRVSVAIEKGAAVVVVSDAGPGILEEEVPRIFERFYRGQVARQMEAPGVGLGLAICRALVEGQGGKISVDSAPGGGATFRIRLPLAA